MKNLTEILASDGDGVKALWQEMVKAYISNYK